MLMDRLGQQFGNYRLLRSLGEGGFAEVYLGEHVHLGSQVAVKVLHTRLIAREQEQFLREARMIASLDHPSIVRVLDCGVERGVPFLIMTYAPYGSLRQLHPIGTRLPLSQILSYVNSIAAALSYAHEQNLIHRDIKPENILLGPKKELLLSDFGIAVVSSSSTSRPARTTAGTIAYMAPEQIMGKPHTMSDQYALGVVIYEWLCGELPFQGAFFEICAQHLYAPPPPLSEKVPALPPALEKVVLKALAKEPHGRFASVQEFAEVLVQSVQPSLSHSYSTALMVPPSLLSLSSSNPSPAATKRKSITLLPKVPSTYRHLLWLLVIAICLLLVTLSIISPMVFQQLPSHKTQFVTSFPAHTFFPQQSTGLPRATPVPSTNIHLASITPTASNIASSSPATSSRSSTVTSGAPTATPGTSQPTQPAVALTPTGHLSPASPTTIPPSSPILQVSPMSLGPHTPSICYEEQYYWVCKVILTASGPTSGRLRWSLAISDNMSGVTTDAIHGKLRVGERRELTIYVPNDQSQGNCSGAVFVFTSTYNTVKVPWTCSPASYSATGSSRNPAYAS